MSVDGSLDSHVDDSVDGSLDSHVDGSVDGHVNSHVDDPTLAPLNALGLAYLGDAVFELYVRAMLVGDGCRPARDLNHAARQYVTASAQARMYHRIFDALTEEEQAVMKRGRNAHTTTRAKRTDMTDYRHATGLEALFGYLHLQGRQHRAMEIFTWCVTEPPKGQ